MSPTAPKPRKRCAWCASARQTAMIGLLLALATAFFPVLRGEPIMTHYPGPDRDAMHIGALELTTPFLFDIGVFLLVMGVCVGIFDLLAHATAGAALMTLIVSSHRVALRGWQLSAAA
ncbi:MAG: MnhB domain-containing protein [Thermomicrobiales bacterium]